MNLLTFLWVALIFDAVLILGFILGWNSKK